jgi:GNAT superfamily N-acetyltransferase
MTEPAPPLRPLLRAVVPADAAGVGVLLGTLGYPTERDDATARIKLVSRDPRQRVLVADHHGDIAGLIAMNMRYSFAHGVDVCHIAALVVSPTYQRRGIGQQLLLEAQKWARGKGAARIEVASAAHREEAHEFYRRCGYPESGRRFVRRLGDA